MSEFIDIYAKEDEPQELTPAQEAMRRRWAQIVCSSAANETSLKMAQRLCRSWFPTCNDCALMRGKN